MLTSPQATPVLAELQCRTRLSLDQGRGRARECTSVLHYLGTFRALFVAHQAHQAHPRGSLWPAGQFCPHTQAFHHIEGKLVETRPCRSMMAAKKGEQLSLENNTANHLEWALHWEPGDMPFVWPSRTSNQASAPEKRAAPVRHSTSGATRSINLSWCLETPLTILSARCGGRLEQTTWFLSRGLGGDGTVQYYMVCRP